MERWNLRPRPPAPERPPMKTRRKLRSSPTEPQQSLTKARRNLRSSPTPLPLLSFPLEIRIMIYRAMFGLRPKHVLRNNRIVQVLRTCKAIYEEAAPILYGDEHWKITVTNAPSATLNQPRPHFFLNSQEVREDLVGIEGVLKHIQHLRRFDVVVDSRFQGYYNQPIRPLKANLYCARHFLLKIPHIRFMHLSLNNMYQGYGQNNGRRESELAPEYVACIFGRLRNLPTLVVDSNYLDPIPDFLQLMMSKVQGSDPVNPLPDMYLELREFAWHYQWMYHHYPHQVPSERDISHARRCLEIDDLQGFLGKRAEIIAPIRKLKSDEWQQDYEATINQLQLQMEQGKVQADTRREQMKEQLANMERQLLQHDPESKEESGRSTDEEQSDDGDKDISSGV